MNPRRGNATSIELRAKLERVFDTALQILDYGEFRLKWFDKEKRRPGEIAELMAGELVKFTDAVQQITGKKGHYYNWRVEEFMGNQGYWDMTQLMRKRGGPKVLIPKFREGRRMSKTANKR